MPKRTSQRPDNTPKRTNGPAPAYQPIKDKKVSTVDWNPNSPVHATQEEWWEHFHEIEKGKFYTIEEADKEFEEWKKKLLTNRAI